MLRSAYVGGKKAHHSQVRGEGHSRGHHFVCYFFYCICIGRTSMYVFTYIKVSCTSVMSYGKNNIAHYKTTSV